MRRQNTERYVFPDFYGNVSILVLPGHVCYRCLYKMSVTACRRKAVTDILTVVLCCLMPFCCYEGYFILSNSADISSCSSLAFFAAASAKSALFEA